MLCDWEGEAVFGQNHSGQGILKRHRHRIPSTKRRPAPQLKDRHIEWKNHHHQPCIPKFRSVLLLHRWKNTYLWQGFRLNTNQYRMRRWTTMYLRLYWVWRKRREKCLEWHIECHQSAPSCEWECTGGSGVTVSWVTLGWYCRYVTQELLDMLDSDKATFFDLWSITTENGWIQCTFTGWSSSSPQSITINWTPDNICVKVNDNTINCNIPLEDLQGGTWTTEGSWLWTSNSTQTVIYPASYTKSNVAIWTNTSNNYTLNVNWSWRIASKFNVWDNFWILSGQRYMIYTQTCNTNNARYATSPTIRYNDTLAFRDNDLLQCSNWYTEIGDNGSMWIGWPSESANTKLSVYWHTRIYSTASDSDQFIDLYTTNYWESHIESKWREMRVWLTWTINWWWNPTYLYFKYWSIGVNKTPVANSTANWTVNATLQINGWIQISNNSTISNSSPSTNCGPAQAWMIQYYSWNFYGCNGSVWKKFDMSSLQAWGTQIWSGVK